MFEATMAELAAPRSGLPRTSKWECDEPFAIPRQSTARGADARLFERLRLSEPAALPHTLAAGRRVFDRARREGDRHDLETCGSLPQMLPARGRERRYSHVDVTGAARVRSTHAVLTNHAPGLEGHLWRNRPCVEASAFRFITKR